MGSQSHRLQWGCIFSLLFFMVSCSMQALKKPEGGKEFFQETSRLEKLAREDPKASVRAQSHLQLAFLYVNSRNPQLNYSWALQEMESYLSMSQAKAQKDDFQNWLGVLKELDHIRRDRKRMEEKNQGLQTQIEKLKISLEKVQEANKTLRDEVAVLKETIERLKSLDRQIEERRRLTK